MNRIFGTLVFAAALGIATSAQAATYNGTIRIAANTGTAGTLRFLVTPPGTLSLFASGDIKDVILQGFYHKANMMIGYAPSACPPGITGTCGTANFISVNAINF